MFTRSTWFVSLAVVLVFFATAAWVFRANAEFEVTHHDMRGASQAPAFRVVQLSDLHLQHFGKAEKAVVAQVLALQPDLVVLSGDAIDRADALPVLQSFLQALDGLSVVAVPGNWEHWSGVDFKALVTMLADRPAGRFLLNQRERSSGISTPHAGLLQMMVRAHNQASGRACEPSSRTASGYR